MPATHTKYKQTHTHTHTQILWRQEVLIAFYSAEFVDGIKILSHNTHIHPLI